MLISTRGRYALRFLIDLAENQGPSYIPMKDISDRQEISPKYAERLLTILAKNHLVESQHGKGGGYRLSRNPADYKVSEVLHLMDEELAPVACLSCKSEGCHRAPNCRTLPMWQKLDGLITNFFDGITVADLMKGKGNKTGQFAGLSV
ncbi:MAG: RrF2 family transcriptional regulator [Fretibacterium sp.]|nr:RrF2 family transcriptional regulator [Fretibacterium sp.]